MKCDHGDHIVCNECTELEKPKCNHADFVICPDCPNYLKPAGDVAQVHLDTCGLPDHLFCKCEHGTPCFDTCFELEKYIQGERNRCYQQGYNDAKGNHD